VSRADDDDRAAIDRAFAEMVAGYHLTPTVRPAAGGLGGGAAERGGRRLWADQHPLFAFPPPSGEPLPEPEPHPPYVPEPLPPMSRPGLPVLLGFLGISYAVLLVVAATFGLRFPTWAGWLAVGSFLTGFGILMTQLPRQRPPDAGDGAVL
jgi:hypothetical protein